MRINKVRMKLVAGSILLGLAVTLASAYRRSEFDFCHDLVFPCILREHTLLIPVRQTDYGFPAYWFSSMEFIMYGYEPILGHACAPYVTYSLLQAESETESIF